MNLCMYISTCMYKFSCSHPRTKISTRRLSFYLSKVPCNLTPSPSNGSVGWCRHPDILCESTPFITKTVNLNQNPFDWVHVIFKKISKKLSFWVNKDNPIPKVYNILYRYYIGLMINVSTFLHYLQDPERSRKWTFATWSLLWGGNVRHYVWVTWGGPGARNHGVLFVICKCRWFMTLHMWGNQHLHVKTECKQVSRCLFFSFSGYMGVSLNGGTPQTPQNDHF